MNLDFHWNGDTSTPFRQIQNRYIGTMEVHALIKQKRFNLNRKLGAEFESICTLLGIHEIQAAEQAIRDRIAKNRSQARIDVFMKNDCRPIVFQNITLIKTQLNIVKAEFRQALENFERAPEESKLQFMKEIGKILPTVVTLARETRGPELEALIKKVDETL